VLIVESDLGFLFWLGRIFTDAGSRVIPGFDCGQAISMVRDLRVRLAIVVVNPELSGATWMIQALRQTQGHFKIVILVTDGLVEESPIRAQAKLVRPRPGEMASYDDWIGRVVKILHQLLDLDTDAVS
jgi:hypothetical protein